MTKRIILSTDFNFIILVLLQKFSINKNNIFYNKRSQLYEFSIISSIDFSLILKEIYNILEEVSIYKNGIDLTIGENIIKISKKS